VDQKRFLAKIEKKWIRADGKTDELSELGGVSTRTGGSSPPRARGERAAAGRAHRGLPRSDREGLARHDVRTAPKPHAERLFRKSNTEGKKFHPSPLVGFLPFYRPPCADQLRSFKKEFGGPASIPEELSAIVKAMWKSE